MMYSSLHGERDNNLHATEVAALRTLLVENEYSLIIAWNQQWLQNVTLHCKNVSKKQTKNT